MSLGLQYKNQEHIFDEKNSRWGSVSELSNVRRNGESCIMDFLQNSEVSARDAGQL